MKEAYSNGKIRNKIDLKKEHRNKIWLHEQYVIKNKSATDVAKEAGCSHVSIFRWLQKYGMERNKLLRGINKAKKINIENVRTKVLTVEYIVVNLLWSFRPKDKMILPELIKFCVI